MSDSFSEAGKSNRGGARANAGRKAALAGGTSDASVYARVVATVGEETFKSLNAAAHRGSLSAARSVVSALSRAEQSLLAEISLIDPGAVRLKHPPQKRGASLLELMAEPLASVACDLASGANAKEDFACPSPT